MKTIEDIKLEVKVSDLIYTTLVVTRSPVCTQG